MAEGINKHVREVSGARRLLAEAADILVRYGLEEDGFYQDPNAVRLAGSVAIRGLIIALDAFLGITVRTQKPIAWYLEQVEGEEDTHFQLPLFSAYSILNLSLAQNAVADVELARIGLARAEDIVNWVEGRNGAA
jgi:hypothetical protein